jgi:hypothetical protein
LGTHNPNLQAYTAILDYLAANANDTCWVTSMQEFVEYLQTKSKIIKSETLVGNKLTINLNYSMVNPDTKWKDLSILIKSDGKISNVTVKGSNGLSYNTGTNLINVYK